MTGPLSGLKVVEFAGIGPAPFAAMLLGDLGADVVRIDRPSGHAGNPVSPDRDFLNRNRRSVALNLKTDDDIAFALGLIRDADVLIEGYRPGVMERLGVGPDVSLGVNPRLVYARMTGWGQDGPLADRAGHDIDYIARVGALFPIGTQQSDPVIPLNIVGDFGGGGMLLAFGILAAVHHASLTGTGQVVDAAITDGTALLTTMLHVWRSAGLWSDSRASNMLDGGAHFYHVYETADGRHLAVGAIEPQFYREFIGGLGFSPEDPTWTAGHQDRAMWPALTQQVAQRVRTRTLDEWSAIFDGTDACVAPVLSPAEAPFDPHNIARNTFLDVDGVTQPAPAPRFSGTPTTAPRSHPMPGQHSDEIRASVAASGGWPHRVRSEANTN
ncbi:CoA transferase [Mycolicibacterium chitae]|uniref:L-carnitine dehydratase/bile acid-inducible protein F n=1 Tax=Mycolicibacterium chitae TaxID=1792 RepID=A0A448I5Q8_MYCCI|nr:CaiB/BaiF CoA-transferase family protein [Mycolicibacterium chitae]MCV7104989.1 CoA transferase [Mycolicibacterium chitae]BBZ04212.1 CoA transferase [Mycolicibacterium chitae]VEG47861.1 L-carnitine dehydratase/bile acid-inducible protein F [Mycolicibacterium chitae]